MPNLNQVILIGNLTRAPEIRYLQNGTACGNFTLAINRKWKDDQGQEKEEVTFVDCSVFSGRAETIGQYVKKGDPLCVTGRLKQDVWEDKETKQKRSKLKVVVEGFQFLGSKGEHGTPKSDNRKPQKPESDDEPEAPPVEDDDDDRVPF